MYRFLLIRKYLFRKMAPLFASCIVALCTMMVVLVSSVMGGFLANMRAATRSLSPEITIIAPWTGFAHYEELLDDLRALPGVEAATPVIKSAGIIKFGEDQIYPIAEILGVYPEELDRVTQYRDKLYWTRQRIAGQVEVDPAIVEDPVAMAMAFEPRGPFIAPEKPDLPGIVPGIEVCPWAYRDDTGQYHVELSGLNRSVTLTIVPITRAGGLLEPRVQEFRIINEFKSGLYEIDDNRVYVPFALMQRMMRMDAAEEVDPETGEPTGEMIPARASEIHIKGEDGVPLEDLQVQVEQTVMDFRDRYPEVYIRAVTWEQMHARLLNAVGNEKGLVTFLFAIMGVAAIIMIATTFQTIVLQKTRDIGVLRALGASPIGSARIFLEYGLAIGTMGTLMGIALGCAIVFNLNELQFLLKTYLGETIVYASSTLGMLLIGALGGMIFGLVRRGSVIKWTLLFGLGLMALGAFGGVVAMQAVPEWRQSLNVNLRWEMWSPEIYYFDEIPEGVNRGELLGIAIGGVIASLLGAGIPALFAAYLNPVEALRYE